MLAQQDHIHSAPPAELSFPASVLVVLLGVALMIGPHVVRWYRKRRDTNRSGQ
ncbi:MAG TPA: hypothetical protein VFZ73_14465 [Gemmatimonadaceae bacterium]